MSAIEQIVIVGSGLAGLRAAEGARAAGFAGRVILIGEEVHLPYDRPPLSKAVLLHDGHENEIGLAPAALIDENRIELKLGAAVTAIDRQARAVTLASGERIGYDRLVLATGSRVRTLQLFPLGAPSVHYVRGLDDALALRAAFATGKRLAVIGAGVIGLEVAASAASKGQAVTVLEAQSRVMARNCGHVLSDYFEQRHRAEGVVFRFGVTVSDAVRSEDEWRLQLSDGTTLSADNVVIGIGVAPNVELAQASGLDVRSEGVVVDAHGRTSDPSIYAAGEVAMHYNDRYGRHDRQETWAHAAAHGDHVGRSVIAAAAAYDELSSYWTDQYDINLQVVGAPIGERDVVRGDLEAGRFIVFHLVGNEVIGVSAVNAVRELRAAKKLIGASPDAAKLADVSEPLA